MLFIITQQVQPAFIMPVMQSQQAWIMSQQALSPLVQVMQTPSSVISHLHMPIIMLQEQATIPFIIMQQLHMPPASMVQRFCIMPTAILSSLVQWILIPPSHFSILIVQRGTIIMFIGPGIVPVAGIVPPAIVGIPIPARSIIIALFIVRSRHKRVRPRPGPASPGSQQTPIMTRPLTVARRHTPKISKFDDQ